MIAAFDLGEFHRVFDGSSKILILRRGCCLWTWRVSSGLRQRQQNPASEACLLPLSLGSFIGSLAEAAKSCFRGVSAAFDLGWFLRVFGGGSKILLTRRDCCLWTWRVSSGLRRRQQNACLRGVVAAFDLGEFHRVFSGGSKILLPRRGCCL